MTTLSLRVIDPARTEFCLSRTVCACDDCIAYCRHMPGYLIPADLERIHQHLSPVEDLGAWARLHLLASPGALVLRRSLPLRIPTLVPAHRPGGECIFLTDTARCAMVTLADAGHVADAPEVAASSSSTTRRTNGRGDLPHAAQMTSPPPVEATLCPSPEACMSRAAAFHP